MLNKQYDYWIAACRTIKASLKCTVLHLKCVYQTLNFVLPGGDPGEILTVQGLINDLFQDKTAHLSLLSLFTQATDTKFISQESKVMTWPTLPLISWCTLSSLVRLSRFRREERFVRVRISRKSNQRQSGAGHDFAPLGEKNGICRPT